MSKPNRHFYDICAQNQDLTCLDQHLKWLDILRLNSWDKYGSEDFVVPSAHSLAYHWKRCCWVRILWCQATNKEVSLPPVSRFGWEVSDDGLKCVFGTRRKI